MTVKIVCYQSDDYQEYLTQLNHPQIVELRQNSFLPIKKTVSNLSQNSPNNSKFRQLAEQLSTQITPGKRLAVIGSTSFWGDSSKAICEITGRYLAKIDDLIMLTGGVPGIPEAVSRNFANERVFHIQPQGYQFWDYGNNLYGGVGFWERREVLARLAQVYLLIEGGPGSEHEAQRALEMGAVVIPVGKTGGYAEKLYSQMDCPIYIPTELWQTLGRQTATAEEVGISIVQIVLKAFDFLDTKLHLRKSPVARSYPPATILIVDDSITVRELLSMTFIKADYLVETARDGIEALRKIQQGIKCDVIFCDIEMPRMDGFEFCHILKKDSRFQNIPFVMLTSRGASKTGNELRKQLGVQGYVTKPYDEEKILQITEDLLNK